MGPSCSDATESVSFVDVTGLASGHDRNVLVWSTVNTTFSDVKGNTFGRVTGARDGRVVSLGLRLLF